jgi:hypothetical protein
MCVCVRACVCASRWQVLAHTAMVVGAMTRHGDVVTWCIEHTSARPWLDDTALVCFDEECCGKNPFILCHRCADSSHMGYGTAPLLGACVSGDLPLLQRLMREYSECRDVCETVRLMTR